MKIKVFKSKTKLKKSDDKAQNNRKGSKCFAN